MRITKLHLTNFRNYTDETVEPASGMNIFVGPNGHGKSALLEAAYLLATSKSHRTGRDSDLIRIGTDWARTSAQVDRDQRGEVILEITLTRNEKKIVRINRVKHDKVGEIVGQLNAVIFSSSDIEMMKGEPALRRRFLNLEISQVSPQYVYALGRYKRVLEQRNSVMKEAGPRGPNGRSLDIWDDQLVSYGAILIDKRLVFLRRLSEIAEPVYSQLTAGTESLEMIYVSNIKQEDPKNIEEIREGFRRDVAGARQHDIARGTTTRGPHRDEVLFRVNGMDIRSYGSQGQQRSAALALKLAEITLMEEMVGEPPVALLDDVASELDEQRRAQLFDLTVGRCQTLVTATSLRELPAEIAERSAIFTVVSGTVRPT